MNGVPEDALMQRLEEEMVRPPFHAFLRPFGRSVNPETGEVRTGLAYRPEFSFSPSEAFFHGGVLAAFVDITGHAAVALKIGRIAPTIDLRIDYLRPAPGVELTGVARVLRIGKAIGRVDVDVTDPAGTLLVAGRGAFSTL